MQRASASPAFLTKVLLWERALLAGNEQRQAVLAEAHSHHQPRESRANKCLAIETTSFGVVFHAANLTDNVAF